MARFDLPYTPRGLVPGKVTGMAMVVRILLSLALVLNGTSGAWAMDAATAMAKAPPAIADVAPPCHGHADEPDPAKPAPQPSECCQTAACQCACAHLPAVAFLPAAVAKSPPMSIASATVVVHRHAAPPLPHQLRPPIG